MKEEAGTLSYRQIRRITLIGSFIDLALGLTKITVGYLATSQALLADGIHSLSDLVTDVLVIFAARQSSHAADDRHPYGHGRIQTLATVFLALSLGLVAILIGWDAIRRILDPGLLLAPGFWVLIVATISALAKEGYFRYAVRYSKSHNSSLLKANAWHSRSDAMSSVAVIVGVVGVMAGIPWADAVAAIVVAILIMVVAVRIGLEGADELIDAAVDPELELRIRAQIMTVEGILDTHELRTRRMGPKILADVHIRVDPRITVSEGHRIGDEVISRLKNTFVELDDVVVHVDPEDDTQALPTVFLPLRPVIEEKVSKCLSDLQVELGSGPSLRPLNLVLHYLNGKYHLEIWLAMPDNSSVGSTETFSQKIAQRILSIEEVSNVCVLFSSDPSLHERPHPDLLKP
ncbi:MAG: cation diffusion facilitator family transporter [Pseudomonadota bacterium]|nr:cation diffusion facilitator family transporter [Pseudomonadota bacterium]